MVSEMNRSFTDFVNDRRAYALVHNEIEGFCLPPHYDGWDITLTDDIRTYIIDDSYEVKVGLVRANDAISFDSVEYDSHFTLREIKLSDAKRAFPLSPRVFTSVEDLEEKIAMALTSGQSYEVNMGSTGPVVSFTHDGKEALELIRVDDEGEMVYRENGEWVSVGDEEMPTIFDRDLIDIEPTDVDKVVALWDEKNRDAKGLSKDELLPFAALVQ
jgi:hypothetical protein